jgi:hypothetical protein
VTHVEPTEEQLDEIAVARFEAKGKLVIDAPKVELKK